MQHPSVIPTAVEGSHTPQTWDVKDSSTEFIPMKIGTRNDTVNKFLLDVQIETNHSITVFDIFDVDYRRPTALLFR